MDIFCLKDKVALVTGGYGHLGTALTQGLAEAGATVYVGGRHQEKFQEKFESCERIHFQELDISSSDSIQKAFQQVKADSGKLDILINNAVYSATSLPEQLSDEDWQMTLDGTLSSVFKCIRAVAPFMKIQGQGKIVNIASMYGMVSPDFRLYADHPQFFNPPNYGAAKAGVIQLTKYYATYYASDNIQINCISPGPFPSPEVQKSEAFIQALSEKNPQARIGRPEDLKGAVVFLSSQASAYMTGQNLCIDGGWTIW